MQHYMHAEGWCACSLIDMQCEQRVVKILNNYLHWSYHNILYCHADIVFPVSNVTPVSDKGSQDISIEHRIHQSPTYSMLFFSTKWCTSYRLLGIIKGVPLCNLMNDQGFKNCPLQLLPFRKVLKLERKFLIVCMAVISMASWTDNLRYRKFIENVHTSCQQSRYIPCHPP